MYARRYSLAQCSQIHSSDGQLSASTRPRSNSLDQARTAGPATVLQRFTASGTVGRGAQTRARRMRTRRADIRPHADRCARRPSSSCNCPLTDLVGFPVRAPQGKRGGCAMRRRHSTGLVANLLLLDVPLPGEHLFSSSARSLITCMLISGRLYMLRVRVPDWLRPGACLSVALLHSFSSFSCAPHTYA